MASRAQAPDGPQNMKGELLEKSEISGDNMHTTKAEANEASNSRAWSTTQRNTGLSSARSSFPYNMMMSSFFLKRY